MFGFTVWASLFVANQCKVHLPLPEAGVECICVCNRAGAATHEASITDKQPIAGFARFFGNLVSVSIKQNTFTRLGLDESCQISARANRSCLRFEPAARVASRKPLCCTTDILGTLATNSKPDLRND